MIFWMAGACFITVIDVAVFFYQWWTKLTDCEKFTVVNHYESEQFNVTVMGFKGFSAYVQCQIDGILRPHQEYAKVYVDDIIIYSKIFKDYVVHLMAVFTALWEWKTTLKSTKCFIAYSETSLLDNKINNFKTFTDKDCIQIISVLEFLKILWQLETYLSKTGYLCSSVLNYTQKADVLQKLKMTLLWESLSFKSRIHKRFNL